jgi:predicted dehydrogenase
MSQITRREFVGKSMQGAAFAAAAASTVQVARTARAAPASEKVILALIGAGGRGQSVIQGFASLGDVEVKYICDLEDARAAGAARALEKIQSVRPKTTRQMREVFDDRDVHGVVIATPEQWHALATIRACQAGKDVYVEKCISRRVEEGRKMVEAARKHRRIVQAGTQHRSGPYMAAASQYIREGKLGEVFYVKVCNMLPDVYGGYPQPKVHDSDPPKGLDWDQWLGPAPERPYNAQVHRNWHGWWDFSGGNSSDGIHQLDLARMLLGEPPHPKSVECIGGRWRYADGGEMPDLQIVSFQWDRLAMTFENTGFTPVLTKTPAKIHPDDEMPNWLQSSTRIEVYGTKGVMYLGRHFLGWQVLVPGSKIAAEQFETNPEMLHFQNFIDSIRSRKLPNADVELAHMGACLEHLGNISYRLGNRKLIFDPKTEQFVGNNEANQYLKAAGRKQYRIPEEI